MRKRSVGWAFVGSSGWVSSRFAPATIEAGHRVVGAFGSTPEGSAAFAARFGCLGFSSLTEMLEHPQVDAVWVASPTHLHAEHAMAAAAAGKAVLVEKPLTVTPEQGRELARALSAADVLTGVAFHHRFNRSVQTLRQLMATTDLGPLSSVTISHSVPRPGTPAGWRTDLATSGGWSLGDIGSHLLDMAYWVVGEVEPHAARLSSPGLGGHMDDLSVVLLRHGQATVVVRASTGTTGPDSAIEVSGGHGWIRLTGFWQGGGRLRGSQVGSRLLPQADPYTEQVKGFSAAVLGEPWTGATVWDGLRVTELMHHARNDSATRAEAAGRGRRDPL